jgi:sialate O-acetylesterase
MASTYLIAFATILLGQVADAPVRQLAAADVLESPMPGAVFQRDANDRARVVLRFREPYRNAKVAQVWTSPHALEQEANELVIDESGSIELPTGFHHLGARIETPEGPAELNLVLHVGDLWILAGQSNMEGYGDLEDVMPPDEMVRVLGMNGKWSRAEEPLHTLVDSPDPVHSGDPATRADRAKAARLSRKKGTGLGLPFGVYVARATGLPIGLVACAHGGTSMAQWDPAKKADGGNSLYGSMIRQVGLAGGKVKGVLWYQGESDADPEASKKYHEVMTRFIESVRSDLGTPELPFYLVQIGRFVRPGGGDPADWNTVQDAQRRLPEEIANSGVVASIDLELDDLIHVGTQGQKRLALREVYGQMGATTPTYDRVTRGPNNSLIVRFKGVNRTQSEPIRRSLPGLPEVNLSNPPHDTQSLFGLQPLRRVAGFSIADAEGKDLPLIFDASVGPTRETVVLKLIGEVPKGASLWYGRGYDPVCDLVDSFDMAVPVFGPIPLDSVAHP